MQRDEHDVYKEHIETDMIRDAEDREEAKWFDHRGNVHPHCFWVTLCVGLPVNHDLNHVLERIEHVERVILERLNEIMSAVTDFAAKAQASLDKVSADLDSIATDIKSLNDQITALQNSPGTLSAADQAALDAIQTSAQALQAKADAVVPPVLPTPA